MEFDENYEVNYTVLELQTKLLIVTVDKTDWDSIDKLQKIYDFISLKKYENVNCRVLINYEEPGNIVTLNRSGAYIALQCRIEDLKNTKI